MKVIEETFDVKPKGIQLYTYCPVWYGSPIGVLGVSEIGDENDSGNFADFSDLDENLILNLNNLVKRLGPEKTIPLFNRLNLLKSQLLDPDNKLQVIQNTLRRLHISDLNPEEISLIQQLPFEPSGKNIWEYFHNTGGFISRRMKGEEKIENFRLYRNVLKDIVTESMYRRDLAKD
ncbi:MAG TPA: hypothetical protein PLI45_01300 [Candidatus Woesebacteria bacterium]|nr:hypothetical protein [Candidatus Woesebacteria bacterium]